jgi:hypothetical protein
MERLLEKMLGSLLGVFLVSNIHFNVLLLYAPPLVDRMHEDPLGIQD